MSSPVEDSAVPTAPDETGATAVEPHRPSTAARDRLRTQQVEEANKRRTRRIVAVLAALLAAILAVVGIAYGIHRSHKDATTATASQIVPPSVTTDKSGNKVGMLLTSPKASADTPTLIEYQDFQCPACKSIGDIITPWLNEYVANGDLKVEYRTMTFLDANFPNSNQSSLRASEAAACADTVGAYQKYHDTIYANQSTKEGTGYTDAQLTTTFANEAGITGDNLTKFQKCYADRATKDFATGTETAAEKAGITGTPTFFVSNNKDEKKLDLKTVGNTKESFLAAVKKLANS